MIGYASGQNGWTDDGSVVRLTDSTDKVGIGTDQPSQKVHIYRKVDYAAEGLFIENINTSASQAASILIQS